MKEIVTVGITRVVE